MGKPYEDRLTDRKWHFEKAPQTEKSVLSLIGWRESNPFDDRAIAFIGMKEVVSRIQLNAEQKWRMLPITGFEKCEGLFRVSELGVEQSQCDRRDITGLR